LDGDINYLLTEVEKQLNNDLNIIILSDHVFNKQNIKEQNICNLFLL
jgi:hypothetical protein